MTNPPPAVERQHRRPASRPGRRALMVIISALMSLLLAEGAVRVIKHKVPFQPDPDLLRSLRPNVEADVMSSESEENWNGASAPVPRVHFAGKSRTNNIGFRMAEDVGPKAADERRVLLLGDSFTEADQVSGDQRFSYLVNERIEAETAGGPQHWRLLNGAIQNGSPVQYILQLRRWADMVKPDVVVIALAPNDVTDDALFENTYGFDFDAEGIPIAPRSRTTLTLLQDSYLLRYFQIATARSTTLGRFFFPPASPETAVTLTPDMLCRATPGAIAAFQARTGKYMKKLKEMAEARGARFAVFLIQYMYVFESEPWYVAMAPGLKVELDEAKCVESRGRLYNAFIEGWLRDAGISFHNPYDALLRAKAENPKRKLWNYVDYHFSPAGHRLIADELHAFLGKLQSAGPATAP
jgi:lysophospholipase L1-like esterase